MGISGLVIIKKKDVVNSAQWFGKLSTVVLYTVMILLFLFSNILETTVNGMILICAVVIYGEVSAISSETSVKEGNAIR